MQPDLQTDINLKAPFPWFGGKRRVADIVWRKFGDVQNYVEPFAGSLAVLLCRPTPPKTETVNDADCYLANFWRALVFDPDQVAFFADWPINEADLHARHNWLISQTDFRERIKNDPDFYDVKIAGWWVWGLSAWIGSGWCKKTARQLPHLANAGQGINRQLPHGVNIYFRQLADRLRRVRVACGDWSRVLSPSVTFKYGLTGVFLDPPYAAKRADVYSIEDFHVAHDVRKWAIENGDNDLMRIALCGYDGEYEMPQSWRVFAWKASGGYGLQSHKSGRENAGKERIWFSPHCILTTTMKQKELF